MGTQTINYGFTKDDINENYDVLKVNANMDAVDIKIKDRENQVGDLATLITTNKTSAVAAINEIKEQNNTLGAKKADLVNGKVPSNQLPNIEVPVQSVNGKTGAVILAKSDIGLGSVDNTLDNTKTVLSASKLTTARTINGVNFDGTQNITVVDNTKAPTSHASAANTYGLGTTANYGHVKTINVLTQASHVDGTALSAYQGKFLNDKIDKNASVISAAGTFDIYVESGNPVLVTSHPIDLTGKLFAIFHTAVDKGTPVQLGAASNYLGIWQINATASIGDTYAQPIKLINGVTLFGANAGDGWQGAYIGFKYNPSTKTLEVYKYLDTGSLNPPITNIAYSYALSFL